MVSDFTQMQNEEERVNYEEAALVVSDFTQMQNK